MLKWCISNQKQYVHIIKDLIREYYILDRGVHIEKYSELIKVFAYPQIYISRRALKHFVERRKEDFSVRYSDVEVLHRMYFIVDSIEDVFMNSDDNFTINKNRIVYVKYYSHLDRSSVRIIIEKHKRVYHIVSMHFNKTKKLPLR